MPPGLIAFEPKIFLPYACSSHISVIFPEVSEGADRYVAQAPALFRRGEVLGDCLDYAEFPRRIASSEGSRSESERVFTVLVIMRRCGGLSEKGFKDFLDCSVL
jgi:hypothetical protein